MSSQTDLWMTSSSPHAHSGESVRGIMFNVIAALLPALAASIYFFGWNAARLTVLCVAASVASEWATRKIMKRDAGVGDLSAIVTGILLAFNLPPTLPGWMAVLGAVMSIVVAKQVYGGIGYNLFNPALIGRAFLLVSFPVAMTTWAEPCQGFCPADAVTTATPLGAWKTAWAAGAAPAAYFQDFPVLDLLTGNRPGCIGETSSIALLIGAAYLFWKRTITWHTPAAYLGVVAIFSAILYKADPVHNLSPLYHLLTGGVILGAFFMATDMVTTPVTRKGMLIFGAGCGLLTMLIRRWGGYPEGTSFAILIMNALTPLINRGTKPRVFGSRKAQEKAGAA
jgi:Na+-translocating ferredoxin:NAD+ oxidoreductase subunit D